MSFNEYQEMEIFYMNMREHDRRKIARLEKEKEDLQQRINKATEYIKEHSYDYRIGGIAKVNGNELLEILGDK